MVLIETEEFINGIGGLPTSIRKLYQTQKERCVESTRDPRLHLKKLVGTDGIYSFRVTQHYRVLFYFQNAQTMIVFAIGHRKDIYQQV